MNILYIASHNSVHDLKWMKYFSDNSNYTIYFVREKHPFYKNDDEKEIKNQYLNDRIQYIGSLHSFSIKGLFLFLKSLFWLRKQIKIKKIELVHILYAAPYALWGLFLPCPYIITTRGSDILVEIPKLAKKNGKKGLYFKLLFIIFRKSFKKASSITSTSENQIKSIQKIFGINGAKLIRTGIDMNEIRAISKPELLPDFIQNKSYIFSPRFISPKYNTGLQIDAISHLKDSIILEYTFVFIRDISDDENYFREQINRLNKLKLSRQLRYLILDYVDQKTMWMLFKKASLSVMTPISDGTPNSALEAMVAKCPLIIPNLAYDAELFQKTCLILKENNPVELADLITYAINDYPNQLIEQAFEKVSLYGNRTIEMNKLNNLYQNKK